MTALVRGLDKLIFGRRNSYGYVRNGQQVQGEINQKYTVQPSFRSPSVKNKKQAYQKKKKVKKCTREILSSMV